MHVQLYMCGLRCDGEGDILLSIRIDLAMLAGLFQSEYDEVLSSHCAEVRIMFERSQTPTRDIQGEVAALESTPEITYYPAAPRHFSSLAPPLIYQSKDAYQPEEPHALPEKGPSHFNCWYSLPLSLSLSIPYSFRTTIPCSIGLLPLAVIISSGACSTIFTHLLG